MFIRNRVLYGFYIIFLTIVSIIYFWGVYNMDVKPNLDYTTYQLIIFCMVTIVLGAVWFYLTFGISNYFVETDILSRNLDIKLNR